jgi:hypothetical protein
MFPGRAGAGEAVPLAGVFPPRNATRHAFIARRRRLRRSR